MPRADDPQLAARNGRYACPHCDAKFDKTEHIKRHIRSHTQEKPFVCEFEHCGRAFSRQDSLKRHLKTHAEQQVSPAAPVAPPQASGSGSADSGSSQSPMDQSQATPTSQMSNFPPVSHLSPAIVPSMDGTTSEERASAITLTDWAIKRPGVYATTPLQHGAQESVLPPQTSTIDPRTFEAWLAPATSEETDNSTLFGDNGDSAASAYFNSIFGSNTAGIIARSRAGSVEAAAAESPLLPLEDWRALKVSNGWKLKFVSDDPYKPEAGPPAETYPAVLHTTTAGLSNELKMPDFEEGELNQLIPSFNFVDLALSQYFARWHPQLPVLHKPTTSRHTMSPLLLLSVISLGAMHLNTADARVRGTTIWKRLQELICSTWLKHIQHSATAAITVATLAVLGQSFALSKGDIAGLLVFHTFHHSLLQWTRWAGILQTRSESPHLIHEVASKEGEELETAWRAWAHREQVRRVIGGLVIHENELAARSCTPATAWHARLPAPCSDELFEAPTAEAWRQVLLLESSTPPLPLSSFFQLSIGLAELQIEGSALNALPDLGLKPAAMAQFSSRIDQMMKNAQRLASSSNAMQRGLGSSALALAHGVALSLYTDIGLIERCCGRDGPMPNWMVDQLRAWVASEDGRRSAAHAARALHYSSMLGSLLHESGLHAVRCIAQSALVLFAYMALSPGTNGSSPTVDLIACDLEVFVREGAGKRISLPGLVAGQEENRRLDAMALLLASAQTCTRITSFGVGAAMGDILTSLSSAVA